jgi:hypothetical protein
VQITPAIYNLDLQLRGRAIWALARYNSFADDSAHDWGVFIFAGYSFEWHIEYRSADGTGLSPALADPEKPSASSRSTCRRPAREDQSACRTGTGSRTPSGRYTFDRNLPSLTLASLMIFFVSGHRAD